MKVLDTTSLLDSVFYFRFSFFNFTFLQHKLVFFYALPKCKFEISKNLFFGSRSTISQNLRIKISQRCKLISLEHRSDLQELLWLTLFTNPGFVRYQLVNLFDNLMCLMRFLNFRYQLWRTLLDELLHSFTKQSEKSKREIVNKTNFIRLCRDSNGF